MSTCAVTYNLSHGRVQAEKKKRKRKKSKGKIIELEAKTIAI